jgi:16S rRNA A1518/A1519 N6-dimethyltransferase RsmA/KsgA/DIM1 with predicted DNA glycosylase/AP lyase activity
LQAMQECNIPAEERGENLSVEQIIKLSNVINKLS